MHWFLTVSHDSINQLHLVDEEQDFIGVVGCHPAESPI